MATVINAFSTASVAAGSTARTRSVTLSAGTSRKLIIFATTSFDSTGATIDSATFDGTAITSFYNRPLVNASRERWFYYDIPDAVGAGTYNIVVNIGADVGAMVIGYGVTGGEAAGAPQYATAVTLDAAASAIVAPSISAPANAVVLSTTIRYGSTAATISSGDTTFTQLTGLGNNGARADAAHATKTSAGTATATWTYASSTGDKWATIVVTSPAASATPFRPYFITG